MWKLSPGMPRSHHLELGRPLPLQRLHHHHRRSDDPSQRRWVRLGGQHFFQFWLKMFNPQTFLKLLQFWVFSDSFLEGWDLSLESPGLFYLPCLAPKLLKPTDGKAKTWFFICFRLGDSRSCNFVMTGSISFLPPYAREEKKHLAPQRHKPMLYPTQHGLSGRIT